MRKQYHLRSSSQGILAWDVDNLIKLAEKITPINIKLSSIEEFEEPYWYEAGEVKPTCQNIVNHFKLIQQCSLDYPIILCHEGRLMDGMHRVCKAIMAGYESVLAVQFQHFIDPDYIVDDPKSLPY